MKTLDLLGRLFLVPALLCTPLAIFLKHHAYGLLQPETLLCFGIVAGLGLVLALPGAIFGAPLAVPVTAAAIALLVDIQFPWIEAWGVALLATFISSLLVLWLLRRQFGRFLVPITGAMFLVTLLMPTQQEVASWQNPSARKGAPALDEPLVLHIVLDEQIGIEGIPRSFDKDGELAHELRSFYLNSGFRVFGRAYSHYYNTQDSLPNLFNFSASPKHLHYFGGDFDEGEPLLENAYFELMSQKGYQIHVYQSDFIDFCNPTGAAHVSSCFEYALESIKSIEQMKVPASEKASIILAAFVRLSFLLEEARDTYAALRQGLLEQNIRLTPLFTRLGRVSAASTMPIFDRLEEDLRTAAPGSLFFAHLMLPHFPYAYDRSCELNLPIHKWLNGMAPNLRGARNTPESRAKRYPLYLEQVRCVHHRMAGLFETLREAGLYDDALIFVHGDHGSRIDMGPPTTKNVRKLSRQDYVDAFSTLYAVKLPGRSSAYDQRVLPIEILFGHHVHQSAVPPGSDWAPEASVFLTGKRLKPQKRAASVNKPAEMLEIRMPPFSQERV